MMKFSLVYPVTLAALFVSFNTLAQTCKDNVPPSTTLEQFVDTGEGYVIDVKTGLMWSKCLYGQSYEEGECTGSPISIDSWSMALQTTEEVGKIAGFEDWRLPNIKELATLVEYQCYAPAIRQEVFPETPSAGFWTNTPNAESEELGVLARKGRVIDFTFGLDALPQNNPYIYVRHVRESGI